jgi:hypothetical protein
MAKKPTQKTETLEIKEIEMGEFVAHLLGASPMIMNRYGQKAWRELLLPSKSQNRASLEQSLKHDPVAEFRGAVYINRDQKGQSAIHVPNGAIHGALSAVAIDIPGAKKAQMERLTRVTDVNIELFGLPQIFCAMVRNSDQNHTPDVRTRPIFPEWACKVTIRFVRPILTERTVGNLLSAAGRIVGVGDWRGQKGGPYGAFDIVGEDNSDYRRLIKTQGRLVQLKALEKPVAYDEDTQELLSWFHEEVARREMSDKLGANGKSVSKKSSTRLPDVAAVLERGDGRYAGKEAR